MPDQIEPTPTPTHTQAVATAVTSLRVGEQNETLIEQTIGKAFLAKLTGGTTDLPTVYRSLGGSDPVIIQMLSGAANASFQTLQLGPVSADLRATTLSPAFKSAAASKSAKMEGSELAGVEGQALHTLALLGGPQFVQEYKLPVQVAGA